MKILQNGLRGLLFFFCLNLYATAPPKKSISYSTGIGSPITTSTADTLNKGDVGLSQRLEYYPGIFLGNNALLQHPLAENVQAAFTNYLMLFYGLTDNLTVGASLPYVLNTSLSAASVDQERTLGTIRQLGSSYGIGDTNFFSMWRLLNEDPYFFSLATLLGVNAPTGKTTVRDQQGIVFAAADQPGTGAWIPFAGLIISKQFQNFTLSTNLIYSQGTEGNQETTLGSILDYNFASVFSVYHSKTTEFNIYGIVELNGEYVAKDNINGIIDQNSGGTNMFLQPGLRVNWHKSFSCYLGINIPLEQNYNGVQTKSRYGITSGIDISI